MAVLAEARALDHLRHLAAQERHFARIGVIGRRRVQPHEAPLADHLARGIEALHSDVVEVAGAVHRGARVGFREHEELGIARERPKLRRQLLEARRKSSQLGLAQHAHPGARDDAELVLAVHVFEIVVAATEEREVMVGGPREEATDLRGLLLVEERWRRIQLLHDGFHPRAHRVPVLEGGAHVGEHREDPLPQLLHPRRIGLAIDLHVDERFVLAILRRRAERFEVPLGVALRGEDRMIEEMQRVALAIHLHRHRVDEERHVVVHDLDHRVGTGPAVLLGARVVHAQLRLP
ncbi:MAG TPA: hypothetical protein VKR38_05325 [Usitatibacter sp.]|nr:hypothetical protein [Usitatibacter sp.]